MDLASKQNKIDVLNKLFYIDGNRKYTEDAINYASILGNIEVLEWWKNVNKLYGIELKYTDIAIDYASMNGKIDSLEWWRNSGLKLKYTTRALEKAPNDDVTDWWLHSKLKLKFR